MRRNGGFKNPVFQQSLFSVKHPQLVPVCTIIRSKIEPTVEHCEEFRHGRSGPIIDICDHKRRSGGIVIIVSIKFIAIFSCESPENQHAIESKQMGGGGTS